VCKFQDVITWVSLSTYVVSTCAWLSNITVHALMSYKTAWCQSALLPTAQVGMHQCVIRVLFSLNALLHTSSIRVHTTMYASMSYQIALITECLITYCTVVRALTTMYASMPYQIALCTNCLITYGTAIEAITTMHASMCYQMPLITECHIT
jgi:hypothetical protein